MRLFTRDDASLAVGLIAAAVIIFQHPLRYLLEVAQEVEARYHVDLLPALGILVCVAVFHEYRKRQLARAEARAAAAEAAQARTRSEELERLMTFGQALANALEPGTLQRALWRHLPIFARDREFWLLARKGDRWEPLLHDTNGPKIGSVESLEAIAERALEQGALPERNAEGLVEADVLCFPMLAGGVVVGVLGILNASELSRNDRKVLGAAAAVVAMAVKNVQLFLETREHSLRDSLTSCYARGHGLELLDREMRLAKRIQRPLSIVMFDIDHFKTINDQLGHLHGDELLRNVGAQLNRVLRTTDIRCRYGGDEFLVILPDTPALGAEQVAECLRRELAGITMHAPNRTVAITASLGVATTVDGEIDVTALIERADQALYQAKRAGRNRFCAAAPPDAAANSAPAQVLRMPHLSAGRV